MYDSLRGTRLFQKIIKIQPQYPPPLNKQTNKQKSRMDMNDFQISKAHILIIKCVKL